MVALSAPTHSPRLPAPSEKDRVQASGQRQAICLLLWRAMQQAQRPLSPCAWCQLGAWPPRQGLSLLAHLVCVCVGWSGCRPGPNEDHTSGAGLTTLMPPPSPNTAPPIGPSSIHPHRPLGVCHTTPTFFHLGVFTSNAPSPPRDPSFPWPTPPLPLDLSTHVPSSERSSLSPVPPS